MSWQHRSPIGPGLDQELDRLEAQYVAVKKAAHDAEAARHDARRAFNAARQQIQDQARDQALNPDAKPVAAKDRNPVKAAREAIEAADDRAAGALDAQRLKGQELEAFVVENSTRLLKAHEVHARNAADRVDNAVQALRDAMGEYLQVAAQSVRIITPVQGRNAREVPELPGVFSVVQDIPPVPLPLPPIDEPVRDLVASTASLDF